MVSDPASSSAANPASSSNLNSCPPTAKTWLGRVWNFNKQMFPFYPNVVIFLLQFSLNYLILCKLLPPDGIVRPLTGSAWLDIIAGSFSLVLFIYLFRCFDEVKDYPTDVVNFPDRPLVSGVLSLKDIYTLQLVVLITLFAINLAIGWGREVLAGFAIIIVFTLAAGRWFFFEKQIRPSLPLALVTHNPILYLYQIYILSFFTLRPEIVALPVVLFLIGDALPGTAWEISRKIRGRQQEDNYTTYSKIWGIYTPVVLVGVFMVAAWGLTLYAFKSVGPSWISYLWIPSALAISYLMWQAVRFWRSPDVAPKFRVTVETFKFLLLMAFMAALAFGTI